MGLDGVEIVMKVEETFDIGIDDLDAQKLMTPGELIDHVVEKVSIDRSSSSCMTQKAFHALRRGFLGLSPGRRKEFKLNQRIAKLLPDSDRRTFLLSWANALEIPWLPGLSVVTWGGLGLVILPILIGLAIQATTASLWISVPAGVVSLISGFMLTQNTYGMGIIRVGGNISSVVRHLVSEHPGHYRLSKESWTRGEVRETVRAIIMEHLGLKNFKDEDRFIEDLGLS